MGAVYHRGRSQIASTSESHRRDLIIQRYDQSDWRVGLLQCSHSLKGARQIRGQGRENCSENIEVLKQVVERDEEATMSPEGLSYPRAKRRLERRWTRMSTTVPQRRIYRLRRKGRRCKATDSRAMGSATPWYRKGGTSKDTQESTRINTTRSTPHQSQLLTSLSSMADQSLTTQQQRLRAVGEPRGVLQPKKKIEDPTKGEEMQRLQRLR
ncbi:hypothetical protein B296_00031557 [Ensete ventricosum]|uniref:Uncharacterized protein n=1 Tax=Ensete ventricosum TaxID=4639 RepID=A0A426Y4L3_ENSVE|nr:hypothetical protein B296_00031557 [Ensete ventricosum]